MAYNVPSFNDSHMQPYATVPHLSVLVGLHDKKSDGLLVDTKNLCKNNAPTDSALMSWVLQLTVSSLDIHKS